MKKSAARKYAYKIVDEICYNRENIRKAVYEVRMDPHREKTGSNSGAHINDPTANKAMADMRPVARITVGDLTLTMPEKWLSIIDHVYDQCGDIEKQIFNKRWIEKVGGVKAADELYLDKTTYYDMVNDIKSYMVELGCQMGLVCVYKK